MKPDGNLSTTQALASFPDHFRPAVYPAGDPGYCNIGYLRLHGCHPAHALRDVPVFCRLLWLVMGHRTGIPKDAARQSKIQSCPL